jgi:hypothetical protein
LNLDGCDGLVSSGLGRLLGVGCYEQAAQGQTGEDKEKNWLISHRFQGEYTFVPLDEANSG